MGETSDLVAIYGAVDRAVAEDPARRRRVAQVLPAYEDRDAVGWFDPFEAWARRKSGNDEAIPSLEAALRDLAEPEQRPVGRMQARRILAIAALVRARPEYADPSSHEGVAAARALNIDDPEDDDAPQGRELLQALAYGGPDDGSGLSPDDWWQVVRGQAEQFDRLELEPLDHRPCTSALIKASLPGGGEAAIISSWFTVTGIKFERAIRFLDPANWPECNGFWCAMTPGQWIGPATRIYHEQCSIDCPNKDFTWTIGAELAFTFRRVPEVNPTVAVAEYHLAPGHPLPSDDVQVDEGSLVVQQTSAAGAEPELLVITTKRVAFTGQPFLASGLAVLACACGFATVAEDFVLYCARHEEVEGTAFPTQAPAAAAPAGPAPGWVTIIDALAGQLSACIDENAKMASASAEKMAAGEYGTKELATDAAGAWNRLIRESATAVDRGLRRARVAASAPPPQPPPRA